MLSLFSKKSQKSLSRKILIRMSLCFSIAVIAVTLTTYQYVISSLESQTIEQLGKYTVERGQRDSALFTLLERNLKMFREEYLSRLKLMENTDLKDWFEKWFEDREDGTIRMLPEAFHGTQETSGKISNGNTIFVGKNVKVTNDLLPRIYVAYEMLKEYGPAWRNRFPNLYFGMGENVTASYWPEVPYGLDATSDLDIGKEEWFIITDQDNNPDRGIIWSGLWYDLPAKQWMVSGMLPIDFKGRHIGTVGHDILLDELLDRTIDDHLEGAYNVIFREDGRLIAHPKLMEEILSKKGTLNVRDSDDLHLKKVFQVIKRSALHENVVKLPEYNEYVAVTHLEGPDWHLVTIYPKSLLAGLAFRAATYVLLLGVVLLVIEIAMLFFLLRALVKKPLNNFVGITKEITGEHLDAKLIEKLPLQNKDEIGELAHAFSHMAWKIEESFSMLGSKVKERTVELSESNEKLKLEIADREETEKALEKSERRFREMFEQSPFGIALIGSLTGHIYALNSKFAKISGRTVEEMINIDWMSITHPDDVQEDLDNMALLNAGKINGFNMDKRYIRPDGSHVWIDMTIAPVAVEDKAHPRHLCMIDDITEQKEAAEERKQLQDKLQRAQKMEAMGLMAGGIAHDLNNILSGIVSYPELLLMDLPKDSPLRKPIKTIQESGMRAADVVEDLLTIARGVASGKEILNLNAMVEEYLDSTEHQKLEKIHPLSAFKTELDSELLNITGSASHVKKVLMNLVTNASEAIEGSGTVTISTANRYLDEPLKGYEDVSPGEYVMLTVSDDGSGISSEDTERIFEPFYTKKVMGRSGTGLGLAVVWNSMQDHKGYINVKSSERGTAFELYFPVTREEVADKKDEVPLENYKGHGEKILVVDDEERQREIAGGILTRLGYIAEAVSSGEEAIEYVKEHPVALIVLDMVMPQGINGRKTYEEIIKIRPGQKAIIASGYAKTKEVDLAQELGAGKYIKKPYILEKIGLAVKEELEKQAVFDLL